MSAPQPVPTGAPSPARRWRAALDRHDRRSLAGMLGFIALLHVLGFGVLVVLVAPAHYDLGASGVFGIGIGVLAYTLGLRHAFDADHIAAIDNTTRKLLADGGRKPLSVGFWFSLGHSTVVFGLTFLLGLGVRALAGQIGDDDSTLHAVTGIIGSSVSGVFLWIIGLLNLVVLVGIVGVFRRMRRGEYSEAELEEHLAKRGLMNRFLGGLARSVRAPWHIYPIGFLFGLGFDTATEVTLVLFAAGMSLLDTLDGVFMNVAYGWAFARPVRKVYYNITITALSVVVALVIGTIELVSVLVQETGTTSAPLVAVADIPLDEAGYGIVGLFVVAWLVALAVWRFGRVEQRWAAAPADGRAEAVRR